VEVYSLCAVLLIGWSQPGYVPTCGMIRDVPAMWRAASFVSDPRRLEGDWKCVEIQREGKSVFSCPFGFLSLDQSYYLQIHQNKFVISSYDASHLVPESLSASGSGTFQIHETNGYRNQVITLDQSKSTVRFVRELDLQYDNTQRTIRCIYELVLNNPNELRIRFGLQTRRPSSELEGSPLWSKDVCVYQRILPYNTRVLWAGK